MAQTSTTKCSLCETNNGMYFCYECKSALCGPCRKTHDKIPATQSHSITDINRVDRSMFSSISSCNIHKQEFSLYCTTCNILICSKCVATKHKGHDFSEIEPIVEEMRNSLKKQIKEMDEKFEKLSVAVDDIRTVRFKALKEDAQQLRSNVHLAIQDIQNIIDKQKEIKITEIDDFEKFEKQELENELATKERILKSFKTLQTSLGKMLVEEHGTTFLTSFKTMKTDFDEVDDGLQEIHSYQIPSMSTRSVSKDITTAVIQHLKKREENSLETDGDNSITTAKSQTAQVQHITGELLNFIEDVTNFNDASEQQKAELIYRELVQKENELRELLTKERVVAVEYKNRTTSNFVKKTNCLILDHDFHRKQLTDAKTNRIFQKARNCIEIKGATVSNRSSLKGIAIVAERLTKDNNYFEIVVLAQGVNGVGVVSDSYRVEGAPGWYDGSVAMHVDDGTLHNAEGVGTPFGPKANIGDIIGCGIEFPSTDILENSQVEVFFTINGEKIGSTKFIHPSRGLFPAIGMHIKGACARFHLRGMWNASVCISEDEQNKTDDRDSEFNEETDSSNKDSLFSNSLFKKSMKENVLITALQSRMVHCSEAADAAWEYFNLKRSFDTIQSLQKDI